MKLFISLATLSLGAGLIGQPVDAALHAVTEHALLESGRATGKTVLAGFGE